jgi:tetratricopeptide (TPR) repeat protein
MRGIATTSPATLLRWTTPLVVLAALLLVLGVANGSDAPDLQGDPSAAGVGDDAIVAASGGDTEKLIADLQNAVRESPDDAGNYALLGDAYYQRARETGDPTYYAKAQGALDEALRLSPDDVTATVGLGTLALARHDFSEALELGRRAHALEPALVEPYPVIADAEIELGRYGAAAQTLERMVRLKPTLATYSRVSYFRELNGDLDSAVRAMRLAVSAGGGAGEGSAYVQSLLGTLELERGRIAAAETAYREALAAEPEFPAALAGLARVDAARGDLDHAIAGYRDVVERLPLPEYAIALGEAEEAAGRMAAAERDYALVDAEARLLRANGVNTDVDLALFEANHGDPDRAVALGRRAWREAPSVRSADAYSWALAQAGRTAAATRLSAEAMRLGSRDPSFLYHAGLIARDAGRDERARRLLATLVAQSPRFSPLYGPRAERALEAL